MRAADRHQMCNASEIEDLPVLVAYAVLVSHDKRDNHRSVALILQDPAQCAAQNEPSPFNTGSPCAADFITQQACGTDDRAAGAHTCSK